MEREKVPLMEPLNYSRSGDITVDVVICKPAVLNDLGEVILSNFQME